MPDAQRPKTLILDLYGRYSAQFNGWLAVSDLVHLMELLGSDAQAVRSAVSRMTRRGLLKAESRGRTRGYASTPHADELFVEADRRIFASMTPALLSDGWVLLSFSMPETERDKRHALRSQLMWLGLGNVSSGLWIGPRRLLDDVVATVRSLDLERYVEVFSAAHEGFADASELVARAWDLDQLGNEYRDFVSTYRPQLDALRRSRQPVDSQQAFVTYTLAVHGWRKFPYLDPGLPAELLPNRWPGVAAAALFNDLRDYLEAAAVEFASGWVSPLSAGDDR